MLHVLAEVSRRYTLDLTVFRSVTTFTLGKKLFS